MNRNINYWGAIILALLFGSFGVQEFYTKHLVRGILAIVFWWTLIPGIVAFIQACYWLYIGENEFNNKYNNNTTYNKPLNS